MKSVGIITLCGNDNYGNKLQNYALKLVIEKFGFNVNTIWIDYPSSCNLCKKIIKIAMNKINSDKDKIHVLKEKKLKEFSEGHLSVDYSIRLSNNLSKIDKKYDYFVVGSDQVWNYKYVNDYNLFFMKKIDSKKCFSYAASFGVDTVPSKYYSSYDSGLNHLKSISVREERGKELVKEISGRSDSCVLIDPTMLLTRSDWDNIMIKPKITLPSKYIVTYFLGNVTDDIKNHINDLAVKMNCKAINLMDINDEFYCSGVEEFLYIISQSSLMMTDSFHACVFSIIYDKSFIVFDRNYSGVNMNSRIDTLLSKFKIDDRKYNGKKITNANLKHDYAKAYKILNEEVDKSNNFLKKALDIK